MHPDRGSYTDDDDDDNNNNNNNEVLNEEKISIDKCISLTEELTRGLEQKSFITQQHNMWVYKIQEVLQKEKPCYMKQVNCKTCLKKIVDSCAVKSENSNPQCSTSLGNTHAPQSSSKM
jgi:hypothetical protein